MQYLISQVFAFYMHVFAYEDVYVLYQIVHIYILYTLFVHAYNHICILVK